MGSREEEAIFGPELPDDATIQTRVRDALAWEDRLRDAVIRVRVVNTQVILEGWVHTEEQKRLAEERADSVWGVGRVVNDLVVRGGGGQREVTTGS